MQKQEDEFVSGDGIGNAVASFPTMKQMANIDKKDWLVYPVRPILDVGPSEIVTKKVSRNNRAKSGGWGGRTSYWTPPKMDREFGFAIGLFIAEGHVDVRGKMITIALNEREQHLADRFRSATGVEYGKPITSKYHHGVAYNFCSAAMNQWFGEHVGGKNLKHNS